MSIIFPPNTNYYVFVYMHELLTRHFCFFFFNKKRRKNKLNLYYSFLTFLIFSRTSNVTFLLIYLLFLIHEYMRKPQSKQPFLHLQLLRFPHILRIMSSMTRDSFPLEVLNLISSLKYPLPPFLFSYNKRETESICLSF